MTTTAQFDLFADRAEHQRIRRTLLADVPATRRTDPSTSLKAEARMRSSGKLGGLQAEVLAAVTRWPGRTAVELAVLMGREKGFPIETAPGVKLRQNVSRRLPELAKVNRVRRGKPRVCEVYGSCQSTWYAVSEGQDHGED